MPETGWGWEVLAAARARPHVPAKCGGHGALGMVGQQARACQSCSWVAPGCRGNKPAHAAHRLLPSLSGTGQTWGSAGFLLSAHCTAAHPQPPQPPQPRGAVCLLHPEGARARCPRSPCGPGAPVPSSPGAIWERRRQTGSNSRYQTFMVAARLGRGGRGGAAPGRLS